jgi:hypothetical protein
VYCSVLFVAVDRHTGPWRRSEQVRDIAGLDNSCRYEWRWVAQDILVRWRMVISDLDRLRQSTEVRGMERLRNHGSPRQKAQSASGPTRDGSEVRL